MKKTLKKIDYNKLDAQEMKKISGGDPSYDSYYTIRYATSNVPQGDVYSVVRYDSGQVWMTQYSILQAVAVKDTAVAVKDTAR
jgi:hypothetical protein